MSDINNINLNNVIQYQNLIYNGNLYIKLNGLKQYEELNEEFNSAIDIRG
jgi:hypothetical protein